MSAAFVPLVPFASIASLERGQCGVVEHVDGSPEFVCRMAELGLCPGRMLEVLEPGSPCCLAVGESRIVLRGEQSAAVRVSLLS